LGGTPGYFTPIVPGYHQFSLTREMVRYTRLPHRLTVHTPPKYQTLRCGTPGYFTPHPGTSRYGVVRQGYLTPHQGDGRIHQIIKPINFPVPCCTQWTVNTKLHNANVHNPISPGGLIGMYSCSVNCFKENLPHFPAGGRKKKKMMRS
jgi:hypothetical protein